MIHRGEVRFSPHKAKLIHHDHFTALAAHSDKDISSNSVHIEILLDLDSYNFSDDSELSLMVKCGSDDMVHVDLGTVSRWRQPSQTFDFSGISKAIKVRLSVTPKGSTAFEGYSEWRTCFPGKSEALIKATYEDLGQIIWLFRIDESDWPTIVLNQNADKLLAMHAQNNDLLIGQIFPQCLYSGYLYIANNKFRNTGPEHEGLWENAWWRHALEVLPNKTESIKSEENEAEIDAWAKELAIEFSKSRKFFDKFIASILKAGD